MKKLFLLLMLAAWLPNVALAADMPIKTPYASPVPVASWSGMYWGLQAGYNLGAFSPFCDPKVCGADATAINLDDNSPFVGGHLGYLVQNGSIVVGPEVGVQYWGFKSKTDKTLPTDPVPALRALALDPATLTFQQKIDWLAYANARVGFTPTANLLIYLTGGAAWAHAKGEIINLASIDTSTTQTAMGFNIGGGVEFKITNDLSFGGEYRHYDFGRVSAANPVFTTGLGITSDRLTVDQAMARFSYRLN